MSLKHALLGFLNHSSMTGYEIKHYFDRSVGHFWHANLSQIYPTLNQMREEGLLEMEIKLNENTPNAKIYHITEKGKNELLDWLKSETSPPNYRDPFLIKVFFGSFMEKQDLIDLLKKQMEEHQKFLLYYDKLLNNRISECSCTNENQYSKTFSTYTLDLGLRIEKTYADWCKDTINKIENL